MTVPTSTTLPSSQPMFNPQRLMRVFDCIDVLRRLAGRILSSGVHPEVATQDTLVEVRDLIEELAARDPAPPPSAETEANVSRVRLFLSSIATPEPGCAPLPLSPHQKMVLGDLVIYLEKGRDLVQARQQEPLPLEATRSYFNTFLEGLVLLLTNFLDSELVENYEITELLEQLMRAVPPALDPGQTGKPIIADAISQALMASGEGWVLGSDGLLSPPPPGKKHQDDLLSALGAGEISDDAWSQLWIDTPAAGAKSASAQMPAPAPTPRVATPGVPAPADAGTPGEPGLLHPIPINYSEELDAIHKEEIQSLFTRIARDFCQPLPSLLSNLQSKDLSNEHIEGIYGIVMNISRSSEQFGFEELRTAIGRMKRILERSHMEVARFSVRDQIELLAEYDHLCVQFDGIFEPIGKQERGQRLRESIIIMEELRTIKGLGSRRISRLFAAGITNLRSFVEAQIVDFSAVSSIDREMAERILMSFKPYEVLVAPFVGDDVKKKFFDEQKLHFHAEVDRLSKIQTVYAVESKKPKFREQRAKLRDIHRERELSMSRIRCALAVLEEFEMIEQMRRIRYDRRLDLLYHYLVDIGRLTQVPERRRHIAIESDSHHDESGHEPHAPGAQG